MRKQSSWVLVISLALFFATPPAFAYLDPATGGMFFSATLGIVTTLFFVAKSLYYKFHQLWSWILGRRSERGRPMGIVFYSEGGQYWETFAPMVQELSRRGVSCVYLSSDEKDRGLNSGLPNVEGKFIGAGAKAYFFLNTLRAEIVIMTTPGLDVLQIRRSKGVKHYLHITHSAGGCGGITAFGLDYFDSVLVGGHADRDMVVELEQLRQLKSKQVEIVGCTYLDIKRDRLKTESFPRFFANAKPTILISPTWGSHGLLAVHGERLLSRIASGGGYNVIVRPHPQSSIEEQELLAQLRARFPDSDNLRWDFSVDNLPAMSQASLMISDWSGILFDFLFLFGKPILVFKGQYKKAGKEAMFLANDPWALRATDWLARCLRPEDSDRIDEILSQALKDESALRDHLPKARAGLDAYPGESGVRSADFIQKTVAL